MTREQAREYILAHSTDLLTRDGNGKGRGWICPICGSGSGKNGTGMTSIDGGRHFTCWRDGCTLNELHKSVDIIDIIGAKHGINPADYNGKLDAAAAEYGIVIDGKLDKTIVYTPSQPAQEEPQTDYSDFFLGAHENVGKTDYAQRRGLSQATINRFNLGFVENWRSPKAPNAPASPRLIIPTSQYSYLARDTRANLTEVQSHYSKMKVGKVQIFNTDALWTAQQPIFIVEGEIDAMSICEVGGEAVALGSTSNIGMLLQILTERKPSQPLIICLDNDDAGKKNTPKLMQGLRKLGIDCATADITLGCKDANETLCKDRQNFTAAVTAAASTGVISSEEQREQERQEYLSQSAADCLHECLDFYYKRSSNYVSTGFSKLDELLDGGLYAGLYGLGAVTALGKTSLCLQIADNIAMRGRDVLYVALEMSHYELIARSLSRLTYELSMQETGGTANAQNTRGIMTGVKYVNHTQDENITINAAMNAYREYAKRLFFLEGVGNIGVDAIRERVARHTDITGAAPVVIIDYLQILAPADVRATDKQNTDKAVLELKRLSRDYNTPVLAISSLNRDNYNRAINSASFKESGGIEYSCDVLIGVQYYGAGQESFNAAAAAERDRREIEVKVLKNRNGSIGSTRIDFMKEYNYFTEQTN